MKLFLLYAERDGARRRPPDRVAKRLHASFSRVYAGLGEPDLRESRAGTLIRLELPVAGCRASFVEEDELTWSFAADFPVGARRALEAAGALPREGSVLPELCRELERRPTELLAELAPPFSAIWFPKDRDEILVQNDGLGRSQLYEYDGEGVWALTNRAFALTALDVQLRPEPLDWAVRWCTGHFLSGQSGFRSLRFVPPGTSIRLDRRGVAHERHDVLPRWLTGGELPRAEALELARSSLLGQVEAACELVELPRLGLSGGRDSRVIASALHALDIPFRARVRGEPWRADVRIAQQLAERAGVRLQVGQRRLKLPPAEAESCREAMLRSLFLFAGGRTTQSYKTSLPPQRRFRSGRAELTGHGGEVARDYYGGRAKAATGRPEDEALLDYLQAKAPSFLRPELYEAARELIRASIQAAEVLGLQGRARWDAFYLMQRERRFISSHSAARTGLELIPFLAPGFIRAGFALSQQDRRGDALHAHLLASNAPDWSDIPYKEDLRETPPEAAATGSAGERPAWQRPAGRHAYDNAEYWQGVGRPLVEDCLARGGFWTELFDPDAARRLWHEAPDELVLSGLLDELSG